MVGTRLYQVGGFRGNTSGTPSELADLLCPFNSKEGGVELILGVLPSGATYLLQDEPTFLRSFRRPRDRPWDASQFRSLSPIFFSTKETLKDKLELYVHNRKNKNKENMPRDRCKANTAYTIEETRTLTPIGQLRADFEHHRVFYRCCRNLLYHPPDFGVSYAVSARLQFLKMVSFSFTPWTMDRRPIKDRNADPKFMDVGWTEYDLPNSSSELRVRSAVHWIVKENTLLANRGMKRSDFKYGTSETLPQKEIASRLQKFLSDLTPSVILLVHDVTFTKHVLNALGVDISYWQSSLYDIFTSPSLLPTQGVARPPHLRSDTDTKVMRDRSRSPQRNGSDDNSRDLTRPRSPVRSASSDAAAMEPRYLDIQRSFACLKQVPASSLTIKNIVADLNLGDVGVEPEVKGWCAGNESRALGYIWQAMASGDAVDDQRLVLWGSSNAANAAGSDPVSYVIPEGDHPPLVGDINALLAEFSEEKVEDEGDDDDDFDPNDFSEEAIGKSGGFFQEGSLLPPSTTADSSGTDSSKPMHVDPYEQLEDEEDDW